MLAAILALPGPEAEAGIEVIGLPPEVVGGIGLRLGELTDEGGDLGTRKTHRDEGDERDGGGGVVAGS